MIEAVLDASALLALLRNEPGAERVKSVLRNSAMTTINYGEIVGFYARRGASEVEIRRLLHPCQPSGSPSTKNWPMSLV